MAKRPIGIYLLCVFFGFLGLGGLVSSLSIMGEGTAQQGVSQSVQLFLTITPIFLLVLGILGIVVAVALWAAHPFGKRGGILYIVLWLSSEVILWFWAINGPTVVQQNSSGLATLIRFLVGGAIAAYLLTVGERYVSTESSSPEP